MIFLTILGTILGGGMIFFGVYLLIMLLLVSSDSDSDSDDFAPIVFGIGILIGVGTLILNSTWKI